MAHDLRLPNINIVVLSGRLTRDVELRYTPNGTPVAKLGIASNNPYMKDGEWQEDTSFLDITVWNKRAEQCAEYLHKGSPIIVEGRIKTRVYENNEGKKIKVTDIISNRVSFLEKGETSSYNETPTPAPAEQNTQNDNNEAADDDVPF